MRADESPKWILGRAVKAAAAGTFLAAGVHRAVRSWQRRRAGVRASSSCPTTARRSTSTRARARRSRRCSCPRRRCSGGSRTSRARARSCRSPTRRILASRRDPAPRRVRRHVRRWLRGQPPRRDAGPRGDEGPRHVLRRDRLHQHVEALPARPPLRVAHGARPSRHPVGRAGLPGRCSRSSRPARSRARRRPSSGSSRGSRTTGSWRSQTRSGRALASPSRISPTTPAR